MRHDSWNLTGRKEAAESDAALRDLAAEFDAWAEAGRGERMEKGHLPTAGQALGRIDLPRVRVFLDLGTGNGFAVRHAAAHMPPDGIAIGLDLSPKMLAVAQKTTAEWRARRESEGLPCAETRFIEAPFDPIPLPPVSVDAAYSNEALYYAPDVDAALASVLDVLKPGARFTCSIDHYWENTYSHDWREKVGVPMLLETERSWIRRFEDAGFVDVQTDRLLDPAPVAPPAGDADAAEIAAHRALVAWKKEVGTLLLMGRRPS